jgi:primosomal protein N'
MFLKNILLKLERTSNTQKLKDLIKKEIDFFQTQSPHKSARIVVDVDPV